MELEKQRNELTQKNIALERSNEELTAFNYIASHDLKEPARKIKIFSSRVLDKSKHELAADVEDSLQRIAAASDHMLNLIDALLTFSRVTSGEQAQERTDLNILLQAVLLSLKETIEEKQAVIESTPLPTAKVIAFQFQQLFENIIGNALKYSKTDTAPQIRISCALVPGGQLNMEDADLARSYYALSIADNGIGFDQKYEHKIFDLFQRLHHKNEYSGTGIGLAICKKVVQNHHGFIITRSVPGEGTTFTIYIPV